MILRGNRGRAVPVLSLLIALMLTVVPLPESIAAFRPDWVPAIVLYWSLAAPGRFGMLTALWMGLALDVLSGALLGQHALALLIVVYLSQRFSPRMRTVPVVQLSVTIIALLALFEFVLFWVDGIAGRTVPLIDRWAPVLSGTLVWLLMLAVLQRGRRTSHARV